MLLAAVAAGGLAASRIRAALASGIIARLTMPEGWAPESAPPEPKGAYRTLYLHELDITTPDYDPATEMVAVLAGKEATPAVAFTLTLAGGRFEPPVLVVPVGTKLTIKNDSPFEHHPYAPVFDAGVLEKGASSAPIELGSEGTIAVRDHLWPHVAGKVVVVPHGHFAPVPAGAGLGGKPVDLAFADISEGEYELRIYFRGDVVHTQPVTVPAAGAPVKVVIPLPPYVAPPPATESPAAPASAPASGPAPDEKPGPSSAAPSGKAG